MAITEVTTSATGLEKQPRVLADALNDVDAALDQIEEIANIILDVSIEFASRNDLYASRLSFCATALKDYVERGHERSNEAFDLTKGRPT